jgi:hypothetical protein
MAKLYGGWRRARQTLCQWPVLGGAVPPLDRGGASFRNLDKLLGNASIIFQEWLGHPEIDGYSVPITPTLIIRNKCWDPSSTADTIGTCLLDETARTTGGQRFMPSASIQGQPKFREIFRR